MIKVRFLLIFFILWSCSPNYDLIIQNVTIIDITTGQTSIAHILIDDSLIVDITNSNIKNAHATTIIDGSGKFLIPSLWDMHIHIQDSMDLSLLVDYGVLGVRDMGGCVTVATDGCESLCANILNTWKNHIKNGLMEGPQLYIAGTQLSGTGWPTSFPVSLKTEIKNAFEQNRANQVDFIKVYEKIPWASYQEIARISKLYGLDFVGHVSEPFLLSDILDLGQKSIEHIREPILYSFTSDSAELEKFLIEDNYTAEDREFVKPWLADAENVIDAFKRNQAWFTPTMAVQYARFRYIDEAWINLPIREKMSKSVKEGMLNHLKAMQMSNEQKSDSLWWMALTKLVHRLNKENIGLLAGSDASCEGGIPGFSLHEELMLMVEEAGLSPLHAIQTATINPASYFNLKRHGKIQSNYYANMILLEDNPLENIRNTQTITAVIQNGKIRRVTP